MITIIASGVLVGFALLLQVTKLSPNKKLYFVDLILIIVGALAAYQEFNSKGSGYGLQMREQFSITYDTIEADAIVQKNLIYQPQYTLYYGIQQDGQTTFLKNAVNKHRKAGYNAIYIDLKTEIQNDDQALQLFGTQNLYELIHFISGEESTVLIAIDNLHKSLFNNKCVFCRLLNKIHQSNNSIIITSTKSTAIIPFILDEYNNQFLEIKDFQSIQSHHRFDWANEATSKGQTYQQYLQSKQRDFIQSLSNDQKEMMSQIYRVMCKQVCENKFIPISSISKNQYSVIKSLIDQSIILARYGELKFVDQFIFDAAKSL